MKIRISTKVPGNYEEVFTHFERPLLEKLTPPLIKLRIKTFEGSVKGANVELETRVLGIIRQDWHNLIIDETHTDEERTFTDKGLKVPPPLNAWQHHHIVRKDGENSIIIDDITYSTPFFLLDWIMYPALYLMFWYRKPVYKQYFGDLFATRGS